MPNKAAINLRRNHPEDLPNPRKRFDVTPFCDLLCVGEIQKIFHGRKWCRLLHLNCGKNLTPKGWNLVVHSLDCIKGVRTVIFCGVVLGKNAYRHCGLCEHGGDGNMGGQNTSNWVWFRATSRGSDGISILGPSNSRRRGHSITNCPKAGGRGDIDAARVVLFELDTSLGLCSWLGRGWPCPPRPHLPSCPPRQPGLPTPRPRQGREGDRHYYTSIDFIRRSAERTIKELAKRTLVDHSWVGISSISQLLQPT